MTAELYEGYGWIKVKRHKMDESKSWEERYQDLDKHHIEETTFLIEEVRKLAKEIDLIKRAVIREELDQLDEEYRELTKEN